MEGFCRACLIKYDEPDQLLQYTEKNRRLFVYSTGLQVKRNDTLTFQLCKDCYHNMKLACKFKKLCRASDKRFKNYLGLKNIGDTVDFYTFLKNSDDTLTFRLPLMSGNSTPANQKSRDDDNESTCTSIRNFMTDILQGEEMPDSEARIIREVIEEEADVLDDSLDSHWLQDDVSLDTDFRLDFSFSPFSTPRSMNNDRCYTPKFNDDREDQQNYYEPKHKTNHVKNAFKNINVNNHKHLAYDLAVKEFEKSQNHELETEEISSDKILNIQNFYVPNEDLVPMDTSIEISENVGVVSELDKPCTIDRNLEEALKDEHSKKFSLDDLLVSPPVFQCVSGASTPTINNILFGKKLDSPVSDTISNIGQCIEKYENVEGDIEILEEFLKNDTRDYEMNNDKHYGSEESNDIVEINKENTELNTNDGIIENDVNDPKNEVDPKPNLQSPDEQFDLENFFCKLCNKKYESSRALTIHFTKSHNIKIIKPKTSKNNVQLCNTCGKEFINNKANYWRHLKIHEKSPKQPETHKCSVCPIVCTSEAKLRMHMVKHDADYIKKDTGKSYMCNICGVTFNSQGNFKLHQRRHAKDYTRKCEECGIGFYRLSEFTVHMRCHTGERPYQCPLCSKTFARRDTLAKHVKWHTEENRLECEYCDSTFLWKSELRAHLKKSKKCLIARGLLADEKLKNDNSYVKNQVDIVYMVGDANTIKNQLPFIETEVSN